MAIDESTKTMQLEVLNYERLKAQDSDEVQKLIRVSSNAGVFFLDLNGPSTKGYLEDLQPIIHAQRKFFAQKPELKLAYASDLEGRGYDSFDEVSVQRLKLSREEQCRGTLNLPADLQPVEDKISAAFSFTDAVLRELSLSLCKNLDPPVPTAVVDNPQKPGLSNICLGLATAPAGTSLMGSHLDEDLLTITFYDEPFLEVLERTSQEWELVEVFENLPIVNVGETFQKASSNRLYAPFHRVKQSPREINLIMYDLNESPQ